MSLEAIGDILAGPAGNRGWAQAVAGRIETLGAQIGQMAAVREFLQHVLAHDPDAAPDGCGHCEPSCGSTGEDSRSEITPG